MIQLEEVKNTMNIILSENIAQNYANKLITTFEKASYRASPSSAA